MSPQQRQKRSTAKYLEAILRLERQEGCVRVKSIARELDLRKGSVSGALKNLKLRGLIDYRPYQPIHLTAAGRDMAENLARCHRIVTRFLRQVLQMPPEASEKAAACMGPVVDEAVLERMQQYLDGYLPNALPPSRACL